MSKKENKIKGNIGEDYACKYLESLNYRIIERNFSSYFGEIDIIAIEKNELVFIEVKTRCQDFCGSPSEAVNTKKKTHFYKTAEYYLYIHSLLNVRTRLDVIEIYLYGSENFRISHIKNAILENPNYFN